MSTKIPKPSAKQVNKYVACWKKLNDYPAYDRSLTKLFTETHPKNVCIDEVLIKISSLNGLYSTNVDKRYSIFTVAEHIKKLKIDKRLEKQDPTVVTDIASVGTNGRKLYSFATKYCFHHFPKDYPIYDSLVDKMLKHFRDEYKFCDFESADLKHYEKFYEVMMEFKSAYRLEKFSLMEIDKYLWYLGKYVKSKNSTKLAKKSQ